MPLVQAKMTKFLGVYVDEHLTWKHHIIFFCKQISKSAVIISRSRFYLSSKTKLTLYYALIYPYITYCNSTWSSTYVSNLSRIFCLLASHYQFRLSSTFRSPICQAGYLRCLSSQFISNSQIYVLLS